MGEHDRKNLLMVIFTGLTAAATVATVVVAILAWTAAEESAETAREARDIANRAEMRADNQFREELARAVELNEAPPEHRFQVRNKAQPPGNDLWQAVLNSGKQGITDVWLDTGQSPPSYVMIGRVGGCTTYGLHQDRSMKNLHFTDARGVHWISEYGGMNLREDTNPEPMPDVGPRSPWDLPTPGCR